jgi:molybdate transport system regulatory protein
LSVKMRKSQGLADWNVGVCLRVERGESVVLREPGAGLLSAIRELRSISAAAKSVGMSYRTAWLIVQSINQAAGEPLVEAAVGGEKGGGARLTPQGELALQLYEDLCESVRTSAAKILRRLAAGGSSKRKRRENDAGGKPRPSLSLQRPTAK